MLTDVGNRTLPHHRGQRMEVLDGLNYIISFYTVNIRGPEKSFRQRHQDIGIIKNGYLCHQVSVGSVGLTTNKIIIPLTTRL